jgi:hypothetical protein
MAFGKALERPVVHSAARQVRELSPRYLFRLRVESGAFVSGTADRDPMPVSCESDAEFPEQRTLCNVGIVYPSERLHHLGGLSDPAITNRRVVRVWREVTKASWPTQP